MSRNLGNGRSAVGHTPADGGSIPPSSTTACSQFFRARVRSFREAAPLALPFRVFCEYAARQESHQTPVSAQDRENCEHVSLVMHASLNSLGMFALEDSP